MVGFRKASVLASLFLSFTHTLAEPIVVRSDSPLATSTPISAPILQPVVPPSDDPTDYEILNPDPKLKLYYGGQTGSKSEKRNTNTHVLVGADFSFQHPSVPLDHSAHVSTVSCPSKNIVSGAFKSDQAYAYAKKHWPTDKNLIFITGVQGCGEDQQNHVFVAKAVSFKDFDHSFTATGGPTAVKKVAQTMDLEWGQVGANKLKSRAYNGDLVSRGDDSFPFKIPVALTVADIPGFSNAADAPWSNAVLLWALNGDGSTASGGGDPSKKRDLEPVELEAREISSGVNLYCVDCGFTGEIDVVGSISWGVFSGVTACGVSLTGNMQAGLYLGLDMFAEFSKTYEKDVFKKSLDPFSIPGVVDVGPYIGVGISANFDIKAEGTLLIGGGAEWDSLTGYLDLKNPSNSNSSGWTPTFTRKAEADAHLTVTAGLGLPVSVGLEIDILDGLWDVSAALVDTPGISATATAEAEAGGDTPDCNDGVSWTVNLDNTLQLVITDVNPINLISPWQSDPLAAGCIQVGGNNSTNSTSSTTSTTGPTSTTNSTAGPTTTPLGTGASTTAPANSTAGPTTTLSGTGVQSTGPVNGTTGLTSSLLGTGASATSTPIGTGASTKSTPIGTGTLPPYQTTPLSGTSTAISGTAPLSSSTTDTSSLSSLSSSSSSSSTVITSPITSPTGYSNGTSATTFSTRASAWAPPYSKL